MSEWREVSGSWERRLGGGRTLFVWRDRSGRWVGDIETRATGWIGEPVWRTRRAAQAAVERAAGVGRQP